MRFKVRVAILYVMLTSSVWPVEDDLTVGHYCEATLKASDLAELEWKERIALAQSYQGTAKALDVKLQALNSQYGKLRRQLYAHYGTTLQDYLRYGASHQSAIKLYLEQHVDVRRAMEDASGRIQLLQRQIETTMASRRTKEIGK